MVKYLIPLRGAINTIAHSHVTRSVTSGNLALPHARTDKGKTITEYIGAQAWNSLPVSLKQMSNTKTFVYELKKILLQNDLLSVTSENHYWSFFFSHVLHNCWISKFLYISIFFSNSATLCIQMKLSGMKIVSRNLWFVMSIWFRNMSPNKPQVMAINF